MELRIWWSIHRTVQELSFYADCQSFPAALMLTALSVETIPSYPSCSVIILLGTLLYPISLMQSREDPAYRWPLHRKPKICKCMCSEGWCNPPNNLLKIVTHIGFWEATPRRWRKEAGGERKDLRFLTTQTQASHQTLWVIWKDPQSVVSSEVIPSEINEASANRDPGGREVWQCSCVCRSSGCSQFTRLVTVCSITVEDLTQSIKAWK